MSEPLSEAAGCALLARLFRARGYSIRRNVRFKEQGVSFDIDGWDASARVGFEFLSSEKEDHEDLSLPEFERLKDAERRGELFVFVVDEVEPLSAAALRAAADAFLDEVATRTTGRRVRKKSAARRSGVAVKQPSVTAAGPRVSRGTTEQASPQRRPAKKAKRKTAAPKERAVKKAARTPKTTGRPAKAKASRPAKRTARRRG